ncbi:peptide deformylase [Phycisphaera mikurensis]|uniref:Peptide deformylase n=1 Tax=Phycisphaera mikurensis (strain NBRC 102666 / KCTC 22515 / FYK2301M01) TaxID=1142394 RepID=I0IH40_PHYMF|nr:peptide deformylase [Phycisphaera mikurensis]MBB6440832.1 peptide deformylase [Phycisphaera mikurensis]BAM04578.1 peptide deformylase [Phycisphaera mikurensis NBRC 102666]
MGVDLDSLTIRHHPDPVLRERCRPVDAAGEEARAVARRMIELMHAAPGVGLAAPQVGLPWRLFVANWSGDEGDDHVFFNPVLSDASAATAAKEEGCLSLPEVQVEVTRPREVTIRAVGLDGEAFQRTASGFPARVWQHECDHLDGVMILDKMTRLDRLANRRAIADLVNAAG